MLFSKWFNIHLVNLLIEDILSNVSLDLEGRGDKIILHCEELGGEVDLLDLFEAGEVVLSGLGIQDAQHMSLELLALQSGLLVFKALFLCIDLDLMHIWNNYSNQEVLK